MYLLFLDQPFYPDKEVWPEEFVRGTIPGYIGIHPDKIDIHSSKYRRPGTRRYLEGRSNIEIIYPSGKRYEGRLRLTACGKALIEPVIKNRVIWECNTNDIRDLTVIDFRAVPYKRLYHCEKTKRRLASYTLINKYDS